MLLTPSSFIFISILVFVVISAQKRVVDFRVVTFNVFQKGYHVRDGLSKIARHIRALDADVVGMQEIDATHTERILRLLGREWTQCETSIRNDGLDVTLITKWKIADYLEPSNGFSNLGCTIAVKNSAIIDFWNVHLNYLAYGPYRACFGSKKGVDIDLRRQETVSPGYGTLSRHDEITSLLLNRHVNMTQKHQPIILVGDFNVPSHLDWTQKAKSLHCNVSYAWPVSSILQNADFGDSFRLRHTDPLTKPGNTWSPTKKYHNGVDPKSAAEPQDRIDFIYFKNFAPQNLTVRASKIYHGYKPITPSPEIWENDWPSDHAAVVTDFTHF